MFYSVALRKTIAPETASQTALRDCSKEVREEPGYIGVFAGKQNKTEHVVEHQKITANHKELTSQVNDFSAFLCMGKCKSLSLLKSFLSYTSYLPRASILFFSILDSPQGAPWGAAAVADGLVATTSFVYRMAGAVFVHLRYWAAKEIPKDQVTDQ